ncbi:Sodium/calcium exchanger protein-domain-containing protein [Lophiotrema nucula]|uniref:Sodium/calcium exchanger protein-domain-containing protein n=1 Tax=Lophiotrema nucula TaxID=690887 RepID=A0A6A5Z179_9PLEO|nr:Sodium/calcium exchanger protein-domain-containing protein [Lophiotrema nucula]
MQIDSDCPSTGEDASEASAHLNDDAISRLQSAGYRISNERPSPSEALPMFHNANGYIPLAPPQDPHSSRISPSTMRLLRRLARQWSNVLLLFVPIGIIAANTDCSDTIVFALNCLAVTGLADVLCHATDEISSYMGERAGALLNVTMGNAGEIVIFHGLASKQYMIVRTSLLGSIMVNILLVLGLSMIVGEMQQRAQSYNALATRVASCLLSLTSMALLIPSTLKQTTTHKQHERDMLSFSRAISVILVVVYFAYLWSQIKSSKCAYKSLVQMEPDTPVNPEIVHIRSRSRNSMRTSLQIARARGYSYPQDPELQLAFNEQLSRAYPPAPTSPTVEKLSAAFELVRSVSWVKKGWPLFLLATSTGLISVCGKYLVESIDHVVDHTPLSRATVGLIVLPAVGNAAELVSAVMFASRKQMDLAFAISIGSAIQIALFVTPLVVILGWGMGVDMALQFSFFEAVTLIGTTVLFLSLVLDDKCSVLKGALLTAGYAIIAVGSYFVPNPE